MMDPPALIHLSQALRKELTGTGVKITEVLPGFVWTEGLEALLTDEGSKAAWRKFGLGDPQAGDGFASTLPHLLKLKQMLAPLKSPELIQYKD